MFTIIVDSNSQAVYQEYSDGKGASISGIARANDRHFKIGRIHHFGIKDYPHKIDTAADSYLGYLIRIPDKWKNLIGL